MREARKKEGGEKCTPGKPVHKIPSRGGEKREACRRKMATGSDPRRGRREGILKGGCTAKTTTLSLHPMAGPQRGKEKHFGGEVNSEVTSLKQDYMPFGIGHHRNLRRRKGHDGDGCAQR